MTIPANNIRAIRWADASLEKIEAGYSEVVLRINEDSGRSMVCRCIGHIGIQMIGMWDEVIIDAARLHTQHSFITECEARVKDLPQYEAESRRANGNQLLEVVLIDDCKLWVCAQEFRCEQPA